MRHGALLYATGMLFFAIGLAPPHLVRAEYPDPFCNEDMGERCETENTNDQKANRQTEEWLSRKQPREEYEIMLHRAPVLVLRAAPHYKNEPWGKKLLEEAARKTMKGDEKNALLYARFYIEEPYAAELLQQERKIWFFAALLDGVSGFYHLDFVEEAVRNNARHYPEIVINKWRVLNKAPYGEMLIQAALAMVKSGREEQRRQEDYSRYFLRGNVYKAYKDAPWATELLLWVLDDAAQSPDGIARIFRFFAEFGDAEGVVEARICPLLSASWGRISTLPEHRMRVFVAPFTEALAVFEKLKRLPCFSSVLERLARAVAESDMAVALFWNARLLVGEPFGVGLLADVLLRDPYEYEDYIRSSEDQFLDPKDARFFWKEYRRYKERMASQRMLVQKLSELNDPALQAVLTISERKKEERMATDGLRILLRERLYALVHSIVRKRVTMEEAQAISTDDRRFLKELIANQRDLKPLLAEYMEKQLAIVARRAIRGINDLHDRQDAVRFAFVKESDATEIYHLIVHGEAEIYTSSFNGLLNRLFERMRDEGLSATTLLEREKYAQFRSFFRLLVRFGRLSDFLEMTDTESSRALLRRFATGIESDGRNMLGQAVAVADVFSIVKDEDTLRIFQEAIRAEYERLSKSGNTKAAALYGLLAGMFRNRPLINDAWIREMAERYRIPNLTEVTAEQVFDRNGVNRQQHFFYDDDDGRASFASFLGIYRADSKWKVDNFPGYVRVSSAVSSHGRRIEIYANKPSERRKPIQDLFEEKGWKASVVVHRGHSFHVGNTIHYLTPHAVIVFLGSCGSYTDIDKVLQEAPSAHIISTKATGTMRVNDPLLKMMNDSLLRNGSLSWPGFWDYAQKRFSANKDFHGYVAPYKNIGTLFLKAYRRIMSKPNEEVLSYRP